MTIMERRISNTDDILDVRDIIERIETLEDGDDGPESEDVVELKTLMALMAELAGSGGDEQWRGDWYPLTLVRDTYFEDYAEELAEDIGAIDRKLEGRWPYTCIDWARAARELQQGYSEVEWDGVAYWYR